jgi:putative hydrolase of the HAD superfamily
MIEFIGIDGDDTLWHNEPLFRVTQDWFRDLLSEHLSGDDLDARLFATELRNLRYFGYGIKGFVLSMIETAIEATNGAVPAGDIESIIEAGKRMLEHPVELLPGVQAALEAIAPSHTIVLITKGDLFDQESKVARSGISDLFDRIDVVAEKDSATYLRILSGLGCPADRFLMIGNSLKSDIVPVIEIGGRAVHIPYHITWAHETVEEQPPPNERLYELASIDELPALLSRIESESLVT